MKELKKDTMYEANKDERTESRNKEITN